MIARVCRVLGLQVVFDPFNDTFQLKRLDRADPAAEVASLDAIALHASTQGQTSLAGDRDPYALLPAKVEVWFRKWPIVPSSTTENRYTTKSRNAPVAGLGYNSARKDVICADNWDVSSPTYTQNLETIADEKAEIYYKRRLIQPKTYIFAGGYRKTLGNVIRRVTYTMDSMPGTGWQTTVLVHGLAENREGMRFDEIKAPQFPEHPDSHPRDDGTTAIATAGASAGLPQLFKIIAVNDDYVSAKAFDGTTFSPDTTLIAKPPHLQMSTLNGSSYTASEPPAYFPSVYTLTYTSGGGLHDPSRTLTSGLQIETQYITPGYHLDEIIVADPVIGGGTMVTVSGTPLAWMDRGSGKVWARIS